ncbi:MAG: mechanosensitive ion channel [Deltaproteobacteria bacterium]|jgi:small conductance mechanosensitive channel|nr:mechanosensitive ion channel [Deltaproteobacteria bacterium]MBW2543625.1 mechanosensitive ion channel [Deltaproteobacteria bacterium]
MDSTVEQAVGNIITLVSTWGLQLAGAIAVLIIGRFLCGAARKSVRRAMESRKVDPSLVPFVSNLVYFILLAAVLIAVLGLFGIETTSLVAVLGTAGLAIGLALQGTLGNFSSGVMLLLFRPFQVGDYIDAAGVAGTVTAIGVFSTTLNTPDNVKIIIPNSGIYGATIKNFSANDTRRNDIVLGISYDDDISNAIAVVNAVLSKDSRVLSDPEPVIAVSELADSSVNLVVRPWCRKEDYWGLRFDLIRKFKEELEQGGCSIPYPQRDVHLHQSNGSA